MKTKFKFLCLALALVLVILALPACDLGNIDDDEESVTQEMEVHPEIEKKNYDDQCFMHIFEGLKNRYAEKSESDVMTEALYNRQQKLLNYIGVELIGVQTGNLHTYGEAFTTAVKNKDGSVDVMIASAYVGVSGFVVDGYLSRYNDMPQINLEADYWNYDYMQNLMIDDNIYLGYSDFMIFNTYCLSFNKTMMKNYENSLDESVYESVKGYRWTLDKMISLAKLVSTDKTGDGKTEDDTFGITGRQWIPFIGFMHASDINLVEQNEKGEFVVAVYTEKNKAKTATLVDKLHELSTSKYAYFRYREEDTTEIALNTGRTLMYIQSTNDLKDNLSYNIDFGVLPYPMYDENQKNVGYRSFNYDGYITFPAYMRNAEMSGDTVELLSFMSEPVQVAYYEKLLGKKVAEVPEDREMLQIIWKGIQSDFGLAYAFICGGMDTNLYMLPSVTHANTNSSLASYVAGYERTTNTAIRQWIKKYNMTQSKLDNQ